MTSTSAQFKTIVAICAACPKYEDTGNSFEVYRSSEIRTDSHLGNAWQKAIRLCLDHADVHHALPPTMGISDGVKNLILDERCPRCRTTQVPQLGHICTKCLQALLTGVVPK